MDNEISKMYKNAGIKKCNRMLPCPFENQCEDCEFNWYPDFTAEKQLKIIQLLSKIRGDIQLCCSDNQYIFVVNFETAKCQWANKYHDKLDEALADIVNVLWRSLTNQDEEEIRRILNENS